MNLCDNFKDKKQKYAKKKIITKFDTFKINSAYARQ